jgi:hydroxymethylbilane synthase
MAARATLRVATRRSALALAQSQQVADRIAAATGRTVELVHVATHGDDTSRPIEALGSTGVFVAAVREAVLDGRADIAVHSMKDLPTAPAHGLALAAVPAREDPRDALCAAGGSTLRQLPAGAVVATGSPRRVAQLRNVRPDLDFQPIRGNVDTRLRRVADGEVDAVVLAVAGLRRLGRDDAVTEVLPLDGCTPAPAQGALAVECRDDLRDTELAVALAGFDDADTRTAVTAERRLLAALEAGCTAPVGAYGLVAGTEIVLTGAVADVSGASVIRMSMTGSAAVPEQLGELLAARLLEAGAADLMGERIP